MTTQVQKKSKPTDVAQIQDVQVIPEVVEQVHDRIGFNKKHLTAIVRNRNRAIRNLPKTKLNTVYLTEEIRKIAGSYGGNMDIPVSIQKECLKMMNGSFASLSMSEIWMAFRLHATGDLPDVKGRGEMYGGKFTAKAFGAVLGAWKNYKKAAWFHYEKIRETREKEAEEKARREKAMESFWPTLIQTLRDQRKDPDMTWDKCQSYMYEPLKRLGILNLTKEQWLPIWEEAKPLAIAEVARDNAHQIAKRGKIRLVADLAKVADEKSAEDKRKEIARKLTIFRLIIKNESFDLDSIAGLVAAGS